MRKSLTLACFLSCLPALPALPALADGPPPFRITYQPSQIVSYPEASTSTSKITFVNVSDENATDVVVSIPAKAPADTYTMALGSIPGGYQSEFVKSELVTDAGAPTSEADVVWHVEYTNAAGEHASLDLTGEPAT